MSEASLTLTATLTQLAELDRYNYWLYQQIESGLGKSVLEVGSGVGNITQFLCSGDREVTATDVVPGYRNILVQKFEGNHRVRIGNFDLTAPPAEEFQSSRFDTVVCLNVLEHIDDDLFALGLMRDVLAPGGKLALLVPAHRALYGNFDRAVGHYRRYEKAELSSKLKETGFVIQELKFFSMLAMLPWFINGRLLKRDYLPAGQANLADRLVPLLRLERFLGPPCGLSLIAIAQKQ